MPPDMRLRSDWEETSLSAPADRGSIDVWSRASGEPREEPIPLQKFLRYSDWFRSHLRARRRPLRRGAPGPGGRRAAHHDGRRGRGGRAAGRDRRRRHPLPPRAAALRRGDGRPHRVRDRPPATTAPTRAAGSSWSAAARAASRRRRSPAGPAPRSSSSSARSLRWFTDREPYTPRGPLRQRLYRAAYPVVGYGPPPLNRLALHPDAVRRAARAARAGAWRARILRAGGSPWVRCEIEGHVAVTEGVAVQRVERNGDADPPRAERRVRPRGRRGRRLRRVPLLAGPARLPLADRPRRRRRARRVAGARPLLPLVATRT